MGLRIDTIFYLVIGQLVNESILPLLEIDFFVYSVSMHCTAVLAIHFYVKPMSVCIHSGQVCWKH